MLFVYYLCYSPITTTHVLIYYYNTCSDLDLVKRNINTTPANTNQYLYYDMLGKLVTAHWYKKTDNICERNLEIVK